MGRRKIHPQARCLWDDAGMMAGESIRRKKLKSHFYDEAPGSIHKMKGEREINKFYGSIHKVHQDRR